MKAFKGVNPDLTCRGYQFKKSGINQTEKANCRENGFHCAENPLDCLNYYPNWRSSVYFEVEATGDIDEDASDSKISATQIIFKRKLTLEQFLLEAVVYMVQHPDREWNSHVKKEKGDATDGFVVARGKEPRVRGRQGDILVALKETVHTSEIQEVGFFQIEGNRYLPDVWYDVCGNAVEIITEKSNAFGGVMD